MGDYWDSYTLTSGREGEADTPSVLSRADGDGVWEPFGTKSPSQGKEPGGLVDDDPTPGDLLGRIRRTGRNSGLLGEFSSALESIQAGPGEPGRGRHNLNDTIVSSLMYPFGSRMGNEHARKLFKRSPAAYSWLTGEEAPPLPWGTYKGRGQDLGAARMARSLGRDLASFMGQLEGAEAGKPEPAADQELDGSVARLGAAGGGESAQTDEVSTNLGPEASGWEGNADGSGVERLTGDSAEDQLDEPREGVSEEPAGDVSKSPEQIGFRIPGGSGKITFAVEPFNRTENVEKSALTAESAEASPNQMNDIPAKGQPNTEGSATEKSPQDGNGKSLQSEIKEPRYREASLEEGKRVLAEAKKLDGMRYEKGGDGTNGHGIDCSRLTGIAHRNAGYDYGLPKSNNPPTQGDIHFKEVTTPREGDLVVYRKSEHAAIYDPSGEATGNTHYGARTNGVVGPQNPAWWNEKPVYMRLYIREK